MVQYMENYIWVWVCICMNKRDVRINGHHTVADGYQYNEILGEFYFLNSHMYVHFKLFTVNHLLFYNQGSSLVKKIEGKL